jgi:hypothetical protein
MEKYILTEPFATGYFVSGYTVLRLSPTSFQIRQLSVCVNKLVSFCNNLSLSSIPIPIPIPIPIQGKEKVHS